MQIILSVGITIGALSNVFLYFVIDVDPSEDKDASEPESESEADQETGLIRPTDHRHRLYWPAPWILSLSDLMIASGMTLAYFPIYYRDHQPRTDTSWFNFQTIEIIGLL